MGEQEIDRAGLERLCAHFGIGTDFHDIWGHRHPVAPHNLVALLEALGVSTAEGRELASALADAQRRAWAEVLPPAVAIEAGYGHWSVPLRLPPTWERARWRIVEEGGAIHEGEALLRELPQTGQGDAPDGPRVERRLQIAPGLPAGYHRLSVDGLDAQAVVIAAPARCWRPPALEGEGKVWGPAVQLYALRSRRNWGMGDFSDLAALVTRAAESGAGIVGLNPLHALFPHNPAHLSPYSPSSRRFLNVLYIDVESAVGYDSCDAARQRVQSAAFQARLAGLREAPLVDYPGVAAAKLEVLQLLWAHFREHSLGEGGQAARDGAGAEFLAFVQAGGEALRLHALFEALQARFHADDASVWGWPAWPEAYQRPDSPEVRDFAEREADLVRWFQFLQWQARVQLERAGRQALSRGMGVGLYLDLAVSVDRGGSDTWGASDCFALDAGVGAPPDEFNAQGQSWGLPPLRPDRLRARGYDLFIQALRANMHGVGALRIDHVMALMRLFCIPPGHSPRDGAYVHYRLDELLAIVTLESQRQRCLVIGEDLGTVAEEVRTGLARAGVLSYRLLYFERGEDGDFKAPAQYPLHALVAVSTHDLPTLAGWWSGHDLRLRQELQLFPAPELLQRQLLERAQDRVRLLLAVQREGLLTPSQVAAAAGAATPDAAVVQAVHAWLAGAPSAVMMVQLEDVLGMADQANLPGTVDQHPNWRRKLETGLEDLGQDARWQGLAARLAQVRPRRRPADAARACQARIPRATYRLQLHKDFGFDEAVRILPYLDRLGVSHLYCSPVQRARPGSTHGYDVVAHDEISPELGGEAGFQRLLAALRERGMGLLLDLVPNHMGVWGGDNAWWIDVLENGPASLYAQHFDIDWNPLNAELAGKLLVPLLGDHYGDVLERGDLALQLDAARGALSVHYFEHRLPLAPETYPLVLLPASRRLEDPDLAARLASIADAFGHLPGREADSDAARIERARDKELLKARLSRLLSREPAVAQALAQGVAGFNAPDARDQLHQLVEAQAWRLAYWRVASDEINYRRFFDVGELAALRMERGEVFEATQDMALRLAAEGAVDGLRIDHPDGLYDPARYFRMLQEGYASRAGLALTEEDEAGRPCRPLYVVAEKIAAGHEDVPESWHVHGTTGYRFANVVNGVMVDTTAQARFIQIWQRFTGERDSFDEVARVAKIDIMRTSLASELTTLSTELLRIARGHRRTRDYTLNALRRALADVVACLPVYRTYLVDGPSLQDRRFVDWAVEAAMGHSEDADLSVFEFIRRTLLAQTLPDASPELAERVRRFARRMQQFSSPVAAKGVEDTAFYRWFPLSSLNEVGGEPAQFGMTVAQFHEASSDRCRRWPHTMLATATHDHKRSEDVRNRIDVLSEMPPVWRLALRRWRAMNRPVRERLMAAGAPDDAPSAPDEYLLYQTLLGTLPLEGVDEGYVERILGYMRKALREAKRRTRWTQPNEAYESAVTGFVQAILAPGADNAFLPDLQALARQVAWFGALNSLSTTLVKYTSPGVPDTYQGHETLNLTLVDPDNRRPVDYEGLARVLDAFEATGEAGAQALGESPLDGRAKLWITWRLLGLRRDKPELFRLGDYQPLATGGAHGEHVLGFSRGHGAVRLFTLAGRLWSRLPADAGSAPLGEATWGDTWAACELPDGTRLRSLLDGREVVVRQGRIALAEAFAVLPAAVLLAQGDG
ncbi:malto-oligosyltrehalose synthase [Ramlibacter sp. AW1]|uniref:4-alpha-glucanotransferase n=1 Tax=Ramlibacter aurantiacus TaxID=2801330 RepID=A0A936ZJI9_9BURK|nr:malto-oligosyltrehalose synthase [Ramlibacter aurantiacus]MBL0420992.1 malto-oligosyltrehalose synthase [Ramlibacter aurantiacus]